MNDKKNNGKAKNGKKKNAKRNVKRYGVVRPCRTLAASFDFSNAPNGPLNGSSVAVSNAEIAVQIADTSGGANRGFIATVTDQPTGADGAPTDLTNTQGTTWLCSTVPVPGAIPAGQIGPTNKTVRVQALQATQGGTLVGADFQDNDVRLYATGITYLYDSFTETNPPVLLSSHKPDQGPSAAYTMYIYPPEGGTFNDGKINVSGQATNTSASQSTVLAIQNLGVSDGTIICNLVLGNTPQTSSALVARVADGSHFWYFQVYWANSIDSAMLYLGCVGGDGYSPQPQPITLKANTTYTLSWTLSGSSHSATISGPSGCGVGGTGVDSVTLSATDSSLLSNTGWGLFLSNEADGSAAPATIFEDLEVTS